MKRFVIMYDSYFLVNKSDDMDDKDEMFFTGIEGLVKKFTVDFDTAEDAEKFIKKHHLRKDFESNGSKITVVERKEFIEADKLQLSLF